MGKFRETVFGRGRGSSQNGARIIYRADTGGIRKIYITKDIMYSLMVRLHNRH